MEDPVCKMVSHVESQTKNGYGFPHVSINARARAISPVTKHVHYHVGCVDKILVVYAIRTGSSVQYCDLLLILGQFRILHERTKSLSSLL